MAVYAYSIANDTANGVLSADSLKSEYEASAIVTALDYIGSAGDVLNVTTKAVLSSGDETILDGLVAAHTGASISDKPLDVEVESEPPFAAKTIKVNGVTKKLFKRVHGVASSTIAGGATVNIDFVVPHAHCKFTGAEIMNTDIGDTLNYLILDDASNTYSGAPGSHYQLNQFGFNVQMPQTYYANTSDYDADLYQGMIVRCEYTNNSGSAKVITSNLWLHEVKD